MIDKKKFPITSKVVGAIKNFKKGLNTNFNSRTSIRVENGKIWVNGKRVSAKEAKEITGINIGTINDDVSKIIDDSVSSFFNGSKHTGRKNKKTVSNGGTQTIKGDVLGGLEVVGDNITVNVEGDVLGGVHGATTVNVDGDVIGGTR